MLRGVDSSHYQGSEDWAAMKARLGLSFVFVKAIEAESNVDARFRTNWAGLRAAGLVRGAYAFARMDASATDDADAFVALVAGDLLPSDMLCLDWETSVPGVDGPAWCRAWARRVKARLPGRKVGIYNHAPGTLRDVFDWWWYARYPSAYDGRAVWPATFNPTLPSPNGWGRPPDFWQFSQSFPVSSEGGEAHDANLYNGTEVTLRTLGSTAPPIPTGEIPMAIADDILAQVKADGAALSKLTAALHALDAKLDVRNGWDQPTMAATRTAAEAALPRLDAIGKMVKDLLARGPIDVQGLAVALAPLLHVDTAAIIAALAPLVPTAAQIATATVDEDHRRSAD